MPVLDGESVLNEPTTNFYQTRSIAETEETCMNIPSPRRRAPNVDVISSTDTSNCFANSTYPALATGESTPARLVANILLRREKVIYGSTTIDTSRMTDQHLQGPKACFLLPSRPVQPRAISSGISHQEILSAFDLEKTYGSQGSSEG